MNKKILDIQYRPMTLDDLTQVQALDREIFPDPWPSDAFHYELVENNHSVCWIAEQNEPDDTKSIIGFVVVWLILDEAHIGTLAVKPLYKGHGIGRGLLAHALLDSCTKGAEKSLLEVRASNTDAQRLYFGMGYEVVGMRPAYYPDNHEDALLLTLEKLNSEKLAVLASGKV